jgi:hypothetical protein
MEYLKKATLIVRTEKKPTNYKGQSLGMNRNSDDISYWWYFAQYCGVRYVAASIYMRKLEDREGELMLITTCCGFGSASISRACSGGSQSK